MTEQEKRSIIDTYRTMISNIEQKLVSGRYNGTQITPGKRQNLLAEKQRLLECIADAERKQVAQAKQEIPPASLEEPSKVRRLLAGIFRK